MIIESRSANQTENIGYELGLLLPAGTFLALFGDLGGGKTCFTRGVVAAVAPESAHLVASPTFAIMNEYTGAKPVYHFDFYRLSGSNEITELGFDEYFIGNGICIAEWAERLADDLPVDSIRITFHHAGEDHRNIHFTATSGKALAIINQLIVRLKTRKISLTC